MSIVDYAIIAALPEELIFLQEQFAACEKEIKNLNGFLFSIYHYRQRRILIAVSGFGTAFAASLMTMIATHFKPNYFLITGSAGAIKAGLKLKDVVIANHAFEAEINGVVELVKDTPFAGCLKHPLKNINIPAIYDANIELLNLCDGLQVEGVAFSQGTVVTSNAFPAPKELFEKIKSLEPYCIDMETSAFYQIAWLFNLKVLSVRGISNILNADGSDDAIAQSDLSGSAKAAAKVLLAILDKSINLEKVNHLSDQAQLLISKYQMQVHPEGGYYVRVYESTDEITLYQNDRYQGETRKAATAIYYLLNQHDTSAWHTLKSDELWHFYFGSSVKIHVIDSLGNYRLSLLGNPLENEEALFQVCIRAGEYFAAENVDKTQFSFVGCTVSPGFDFSDFDMCDQKKLIEQFKQHIGVIQRLTVKVE